MFGLFFSNIEKKEYIFSRKKRKEEAILKKINVEKIKNLIQKGILSDREALFYRQIEE
jgi:hypothetical protein